MFGKRKKRTSRKKRKINYKLLIAAGALSCFIAAIAIYFASSFRDTEREFAVYSSMDEPTLPVVYANIEGYDANIMHGYMQDMGNEAASDSITPLPEDRRLGIKIRPFGNSISELSYEVRSLDLEHYIEKTEVGDISTDENGDLTAELPIQNMIERDTPYLLKIQLGLGERTVNYYTKIIWSDNDVIFRMLQTASNFTESTFDYEKARELTMYLETDPNADNSSLSKVTIQSSFSQLTWGSSGMRLSSDLSVTVREYDGIMGAIEIKYETESAGADGENPDRYVNTDEFVMRDGAERIYIMNYTRTTNQLFEGNKHLFAGNRIRLGITGLDSLQTKKSENGRFIIFKTNKELWSYDQTRKNAVNVFSFRSETDTLRAGYDKFDIKILSAGDNGDVDFVVYGYMNRGSHEGYNGIVYYRYSAEQDTIQELLFIPVAKTYDKIKYEVDELCTRNESDMFYIKQNDAVMAVDLTSLEMLDIVSGLSEERFASSYSRTKIAWLEGDTGTENSIRFMNLATGGTGTITAGEGETLSVIDFYNEDLVYGVSEIEPTQPGGAASGTLSVDYNAQGGADINSGTLMRSIVITDENLETVMEYTKDGLYFDDISLEDDRIHVSQYRKTGSDGIEYSFAGKDTIVSSEAPEIHDTDYVSGSESDLKKLVYSIDLDETIKSTKNLTVTAPRNISYERAGTIEPNRSSIESMRFYAYAGGKLAGCTSSLADAQELCYNDMGWVTDANSVVFFSRADRRSSNTVEDPFRTAQPMVLAMETYDGESFITDDGYAVVNAGGIELNRVLYYVGKDYPVMARLGDGDYCLIYSYNSDSVGLYYPSEDEELSERRSMDIDTAATYFAGYQNDFIVFMKYPGK